MEVLLIENDGSSQASVWIGAYKPGDKYLVMPGAPGIGRWIYKVTKTNAAGLWGKLIKSTVREMTEEESR